MKNLEDNAKHMIKKRSIILKFLIPYTIFIIFVSVLIYTYYYNSYKENFLYTTSDVVNNIAVDMSKWISEYKLRIDIMCNFFNVDMSLNNMNRACSNMKNHAKEFVDVYFGNDVPYNQGGIFATALPDSFPEDYDQTTRDWYIGAVNTNAVFVTEPYIDVFTSSLVVSLSKAIRNPDGSLKGVAGLDVLASKVDELMNQINNESGYEFYMVLSDGRYMSHINKEYLLNDRYSIFNIPEFMNLKNSLDSNGEAISIIGKKWYGLKQIEGFPWYVAANGNIDKLRDKVNRLIIYIVFFIILFIALETVLVTFITIPITNILNNAIGHIENMALGNFDIKENNIKISHNIAYALSSSIDDMQKNISSVIYNLKLDIDSINSEMEKISLGNNDLSNKTIDQSSSINELASAIQFLSSSIADTYNNTNKAKEVSKKALECSIRGVEMVAKTSSNMAEISEASKQISEIIKMIQSIAFQTNILALNAAVEAARAGEQGKGFAVVASEVRNLAQTSSKAADDITAIVESTIQKINSGYETVAESSSLLNEINNLVTDVSNSLVNISNAAEQEKDNIEQINISVSSISDITQRNSSLANDSAVSSKEILSKTEHIAENISYFKFKN